MKGRGCRVISDDKLKEVTPSADTKECYYIVDAVGVTEHERTLKNLYPVLARTLPKELCNLANNLWFKNNENQKQYREYAGYEINEDSSYGLSEYANNYNMSHDGLYKKLFLWNIFTEQFRIGFDWAIKFINRAIQNYVDNESEYACKVNIYFVDENKVREYYGNPQMWLAGKSVVRFAVKKKNAGDDDNDDEDAETNVPFQIAYAVSIHKAQGLEYNSVKIVITKEVDEMITHNIFYTAITRARENLKVYWTPESQKKILDSFINDETSYDAKIFSARTGLKIIKKRVV